MKTKPIVRLEPCVLLLISFLILGGTGRVQAQSAAHYKVVKSVFDQGGNFSQSANYGLKDAAGQPFPAGAASCSNYGESSGFFAGGILFTGVEKEPETKIPASFNLFQNYPNPFNPTTSIAFEVAKSTHVELKVFDTRGREVATLVNQKYGPGKYKAIFDAHRLPSGLYFYRVRMGSFVAVKKMLLLE